MQSELNWTWIVSISINWASLGPIRVIVIIAALVVSGSLIIVNKKEIYGVWMKTLTGRR